MEQWKYQFEDKFYYTWEAVMEAVMEAHPEALDDMLVEIAESEVEDIY